MLDCDTLHVKVFQDKRAAKRAYPFNGAKAPLKNLFYILEYQYNSIRLHFIQSAHLHEI